MSALAGCELLIFDCDGVLVDSERLSIRAIVEVLRGAGIPATASMIEKHVGMKMADTLLRLAEETGHAIPAATVEGIWPATRAIFEVELRATPGIAGFLNATDAVRRCVASSSDPERIAVSLGLAGLAPRFGANLFSSSQVARGKPAPDLFLFAADRMGVDPGRCIVIEDSVHGVRAARAAGMTPFGYAGGSHVAPGHEQLLTEAGAEDVATDWGAMLKRLTA